MRRNGRFCRFPAVVLAVAGIFICVTHLSAEVLLVLISVLLIALGIWLLIS